MDKDFNRGKYSSPDGSPTWEYLSAMFSAFGMTCIGAMIGWNSPSLEELRAPNSRIPITPEQASNLTASFAVGTMFALPLSAIVIDRIGRRNTVVVATIPMLFHWGMIILARNIVILIVARMMAGFSMGLVVCTCPIYMVEILSPKTRGSLGAVGGVTCFGGILFMFAAAPYLGIRITAAVCLGLTIAFLVCFWCIPESPYFLVMMGRLEEAESSLEKLRGKTDVADEMELIKTTIRQRGKSLIKTAKTADGIVTENENPFRLLFTVRGNIKAFVVGTILTTVQHFCGFGTILNYCHIILQDMGSGLSVYKATLTFSILQILAIFLYALVVDRFGRRVLLFTSGISTVFLLTVIATYFYMIEHLNMNVKAYGMIPMGSMFLLVVALNLGIITLPTMIMAEIFATNVKALGGCIVGIIGAGMGIVCSKIYLPMATSWGYGHSIPFFCFAIITIVCVILLAYLLPETKGRTLLEIQEELNEEPVKSSNYKSNFLPVG